MKTVLIVEDEKMIRKGIHSMVDRCGVPVETVIECNNGQTALKIMQEQEVEVLFTDIRMPKMDGMELVAQMQKLDHIPITVAISGYDDFSYAVEMMRHGVREYLLKPVDRNKIKALMETFEEEIHQKQMSQDAMSTMAKQQLLHVLTSENASAEEIKALKVQMGERLEAPYVVVCGVLGGEAAEKVAGEAAAAAEASDSTSVSVAAAEICTGAIAMDFENRCRLYFLPADQAEELMEQAKTFCRGISGVHSGAEELHQAYRESIAARKEAFCFGKTKAYQEADHGEEPVDTNKIHQMIQMLGTARYPEALSLWKNLIFKTRRGAFNMDSFAENAKILWEGIEKLYGSNISGETEGAEGSGRSSVKNFASLYRYTSLESYEAETAAWMEEFGSRLQQEHNQFGNKQKLQEAVDYINEHFEEDLNMAMVSNEISMNYSQFSQEFKQYTGESFVNYIRNKRMAEAKKLLAETNLQVNEIADRIGYHDVKHFMKTFKAQFGVSPTEYRKNVE